jgi:hypothetical protein
MGKEQATPVNGVAHFVRVLMKRGLLAKIPQGLKPPGLVFAASGAG